MQRMVVQYDRPQGLAKASITEGIEAGRQYIRHYAQVEVITALIFCVIYLQYLFGHSMKLNLLIGLQCLFV
jgi:hypothetical protein